LFSSNWLLTWSHVQTCGDEGGGLPAAWARASAFPTQTVNTRLNKIDRITGLILGCSGLTGEVTRTSQAGSDVGFDKTTAGPAQEIG